MATTKTTEPVAEPEATATGGNEPSSVETCGQFPAAEVRATFTEPDPEPG
jgi:hypothetical protein